jgi:putative DNA methylase
VLINKALIEIPPKFAGMPPVNPESRKTANLRVWKGAEGLAEDVRYYGKWMRDEAFKRIGHLYPPVKITKELAEDRPDLEPYVGKELTVIAWLWARTVASPNPACDGVHVPLVSTFWLSKKKGKEAWIEPIVDRENNSWRFEVRVRTPEDPKSVDAGTKVGRGDFRCILSGDPMPASYVRAEGQAGRMSDRLMAIVCEGNRKRVYIPPIDEHEKLARVPIPEGAPDTDLPEQALGFRVQNYGIKKHRNLFSNRQLTLLETLCSLVLSAKIQAEKWIGYNKERQGLMYAEGLAVYLCLIASRQANYSSTLCVWSSHPKDELPKQVFLRQALVMSWDYAEANPFSSSGGNIAGNIKFVCNAAEKLGIGPIGDVKLINALDGDRSIKNVVVETDPPYYDNISYAALADFFYIWIRKCLNDIYPAITKTLLSPKRDEVVAEPGRHESPEKAGVFFENGLRTVFSSLYIAQEESIPLSVFYAFKQYETTRKNDPTQSMTHSTGWETMLQGLIDARFSVCGTWPIRTEQPGGVRIVGRNALASSVVLVCRKRSEDAAAITRADFRRALRRELPAALKLLQKGNIAPVDMAQASIGPGMAIFSRHSQVIEADGSSMSVRTALQLINEALDEYLVEQTGEFGPDTRFAVTWFETFGFQPGPYGEAETLAKARNVAVAGVVQSGVLHSAAGKVRLLRRDEMPDDWDPATDDRLTVWEATQHLIKRLEDKGEAAAAKLLADLRDKAEPARELAYRLYSTCERKKWAEEARAYNGLVVAWPDLAKMAAQQTPRKPVQGELL